MLTTMFYYNYYKPYLIRGTEPRRSSYKEEQNEIRSNSQQEAFQDSLLGTVLEVDSEYGTELNTKYKRLTERDVLENTKDATFLLNKSLKQDVIQYARHISASVTGVKNASKNLVAAMENYNKNTLKHGEGNAKELISDNIENFVSSVNYAEDFCAEQVHSPALSVFADALTENILMNQNRLSMLGIRVDEDNRLTFDSEQFGGLSASGINSAIGENIDVVQSTYGHASRVLTEPLSEHMNFKSLGYYYNYKYGVLQADTFKVIESGMILDKAV